MAKTPVMFVHGMWLHSTSWQPRADRFEAAGYDPVMPEWPGVADTVAGTRENPDAQAGNGLNEIGEHLAQFAATLDSKPILIGHSVGGFLVEKLLGDDVGRAAIPNSPGQIKGESSRTQSGQVAVLDSEPSRQSAQSGLPGP